MSLDFNYGACREPHTDPADEEKMHPDLYALVWLTMPLGMGTITKKNAARFWVRLAYYERLHGSNRFDFVDGKRVDRPFTYADVVRWIGLRTNVSLETDRKWRDRMFRSFERDMLGCVPREEKS